MTYYEVEGLLADPAGRQGLPVLLPAGGEILHHPAVSRHDHEGPGFYEISGLACSGTGKIAKVMVSADGGKTWAEAALAGPVHPKAFTRFRMPWRWDGGPAVLQSRAWDDKGHVQPTRAEFVPLAENSKPCCRWSHSKSASQRRDELGGGRARKGVACLCVNALFAASALAAGIARRLRRRSPDSPNLGKPVSPADMARWDIEILAAMARGLPPGEGTAAQGAPIFADQMRGLSWRWRPWHRPRRASGLPAPPVHGPRRATARASTPPRTTIANYWPYAPPLFGYIRAGDAVERAQVADRP